MFFLLPVLLLLVRFLNSVGRLLVSPPWLVVLLRLLLVLILPLLVVILIVLLLVMLLNWGWLSVLHWSGSPEKGYSHVIKVTPLFSFSEVNL